MRHFVAVFSIIVYLGIGSLLHAMFLGAQFDFGSAWTLAFLFAWPVILVLAFMAFLILAGCWNEFKIRRRQKLSRLRKEMVRTSLV